MGITYPNAPDDFTVPSLPEATPTSEAGSGTRNVVESIRDLGLAVEAVEVNTSLKGHDHSGDATDIHHGPQLVQANTHQSPDTDAGLTSLHHTLGTLPFQAAAGDHHHDYNGGTIDNKPYEICLSTQRPTNPFLGKQIYEVDTNRHRVWSAFTGNSVAPGIQGIDNFEVVNANGMSSDWHVTLIGADTTMGHPGTPDGHTLSWVDREGILTQSNRSFARNVNTTYGHTLTPNQVITFQTGGFVMEQTPFGIGDACYDDFYFRVSDDETQYVRVAIAAAWIDVMYSLNSTTKFHGELTLGNRIYGTAAVGAQITWTLFCISNSSGVTTLSFYRNGAFFGSVTDSGKVMNAMNPNLGWGQGFTAAGALLTQVTPANLNYVAISDAENLGTTQRWTLMSDASIPHCLLRQTVAQQLNKNSGTIINWQQVDEDNFTMFSSAVPTQITCIEPGMYHVDAAFQWDAQIVPDTGTVVLCVNGLETAIRNQAALRGNNIQPGFSQSLTLSGKVRLNAGDYLTLKVSYVDQGGLLGFIFSFFFGQPASKIQSRIDVSYLGL